MSSWQITIPGRPVPKARPRVCKNGHTYTPERTKNAEETMQWHIKQVLKDIVITKPVILRAYFNFRSAKNAGDPHTIRPDLDNLVKLVCDALLPWLSDDAIITEIHARKIYTIDDSTYIEMRVLK